MGFSFGDVNGDGIMDIFVPSVGDYMVQQFGIAVPPGFFTSSLFLGAKGGTSSIRPPPTPVSTAKQVTPFGWGNAMFDYDNNGTTDIAFYGALDAIPFITSDNPGVVLSNDGAGT